jgi:hypothetical protein
VVFCALAIRHGGNHLRMVQHFQRLGRVRWKLAGWWREEGEPLDFPWPCDELSSVYAAVGSMYIRG